MPLSYTSGAASSQSFGILKSVSKELNIRQNAPSLRAMNSSTSNNNLNFIVSGQEPISYQWYLDGEIIPGATSNQLLDITATGVYTCTATNAYSTVTSNPCTVYYNSDYTGMPPAIVTEPEDSNVLINETAVFYVFAIGAVALNYQWYENGVPVGPNGASLAVENSFDPAYGKEGYSYYCRIWNTFGEITTKTVFMRFKDVKPLVTPILSKTVLEGSDITLSADIVLGRPEPLMEWYTPGEVSPIFGQAQVIEANVPPFKIGGDNVIRWRAVNRAGEDRGYFNVTVVKNDGIPFSITQQPVDVTLNTFSSANMSVGVVPAVGNYSYEWYIDAKLSVITSTPYLEYYPSCSEDYGSRTVEVKVNLTIDDGINTPVTYSQVSGSRYIYFNYAAAIITHPSGVTANSGDVVSFSVEVCSPKLYIYEWYEIAGGTTSKIPGANNSTINLLVSTADNGKQYFCKISLPDGTKTVESNSASLQVSGYN
jgi:hypothetical protein